MKNKISKITYYFAYSLIIISYLCSRFPIISESKKFIMTIALLSFLTTFITQAKKYNSKNLIMCIIAFIFFSISYSISANNILLLGFLFIICSKNIDPNKFIRFDMILKIILTILIILSWKLGIITEVVMHRTDGIIRHSLGFGHPNGLGKVLFCICAEIIYLNFKNMKIKDYFLIIIAFLISNFICDCRGATIAIIILILIQKIQSKHNIISKKILISLPLILTFFSFISALLFIKNPGNELLLNINKLTSGRIKCAADFISNYPLNLFGNVFEFLGQWNTRGQYLTVLDNSFVFLPLQFGLISAIIVLLFSTKVISHLIKNKNMPAVYCISAFLILGLMENCAFNINSNSMIIFASSLVYKETINNNVKTSKIDKKAIGG